MQTIYYITGILSAYLIGSIPSSVWMGKVFYHLDIREHGSGNAGATNTFRVIGIRAGIIVLLLDTLKGFLAVSLAGLFPVTETGTEQYMLLREVMGLVAVAGHIFPVFAGFRGGKGVATLLGVSLALVPLPVLACLLIFLSTLALSRYVSLSSLLAALALPAAVFLLANPLYCSMLVFAMLTSITIIITHTRNINRLLKGEEVKIRLPS
jgi:glycerol-3-phosphate acyltransferase PlsY